MEIITGVERRRRWRLEDKLRILAELEQPGALFSDVARRNEVSRGLLQTWRRYYRDGSLTRRAAGMFMPVQITDASNTRRVISTASAPACRTKCAGVMEIDLGGGRRVRVDRDVDTDALRRVIEALAPR